MENVNRLRIMNAARDLFNTRGYRNVTVQDLSEKLGMSKKTIYQYFVSKEEIAAAVLDETMSNMDRLYDSCERDPSQSDPLTVLKLFVLLAKDEMIRLGPMFRHDLEKFLPELNGKYQKFSNEKKKRLGQLLEKAQEMGLIKEDISVHLTIEILLKCIKALVQQDNRFQSEDGIDLFLDIFCKGIVGLEVEESGGNG